METNMSELFSQDFIIKLKEALKTINDDNLKQMQKPVILHLYLILKRFENHPESMICSALDCLHLILQKIEISTWKQFMELFVQLCGMLNPPPCDPDKDQTKRSEQFKLSIVVCLKSLILHSSESVLMEVYRAHFLPPLGHAIWALLQTFELEKWQKLQIEALDCLVLLTQVDQGRCKYFMTMVGNVLASFLPGISSSLLRLLLNKELFPNKVAAAAIISWAKIVSVILNDEYVEAIKEQPDQGMTDNYIDGRLRQIQVKRDCVWIESTTVNLLSHVNGIVKLTGCQSIKVKMALLEWADILLRHCFKLLEASVADILNMLITSFTDEFPEISSRSQQILQLYCEHLENNSFIFEDILLQNLISIARNFHQDILSKGDAEKLILVRRLKGYFKILGHKVESFLNTGDNIQVLCDSLFHLLEMNSSATIIQDKQIVNSATDLIEVSIPFIPSWPHKNFKHFVDNRILQEVCQLCHLLGRYGNMELLVDYLIPIVTKENRQILFIINEIIEGGKHIPDRSLEMNTGHLLSVINLALSQYLKPSQWHIAVPQNLSERETKLVNFQIVNVSSNTESQLIQSHVLFVCMVLESIGKFAMVLGKAFKELLLQVLYPVMESLASEHFNVSYTAYQCLMVICTACENRSLQELVLHNADYLIHGISLRLRHFPLNPKAPLLLKVMLEHCTAEVLPLIENTVYELLDVLDNHYHENSLIFMQVLQSLVTAIHRWFPPKIKLISTDEKKPKDCEETSKYNKKNISAEEVKSYFLEYHHLKKIADGKVQDDQTFEATEEEECERDQQLDNKKHCSPFHVEAVVQVLERCMHLLSFRDIRLRFVVLNTIQEAALALDDWQDDLLPMVHKIWSPFVQRFRNEEHLITLKAFETLCTLGHICGNFIYKRTIKDIWPHIITYLEKMSFVSYKSNDRFKHSPQFKLLHGLLGGLGTLCIKIDVSEIELDNIASACLPYLSRFQPLLLQEATIITFRKLIQFDPDAIWLKLKDVYCEKAELQHPDTSLFSIKFAGIVNSEFAHNGEKLLRLIEA